MRLRELWGRLAPLTLLPASACMPGPNVLPPPAAAATPTNASSAPEPASLSATSSPPEPEAAEVEPPRFGWVLPVDHGIRLDRAGRGDFLAPRYHGKHNGLDLLAPVGTAVLAPCSGKGRAGSNSSHGKWVHVVCPLPKQPGVGAGRHASFFFAHLSRASFSDDETHDVALGEVVGAVGKSGNASGSSVAPHLHFEAIVQDSEATALGERHSGREHGETAGSREVSQQISAACLAPSSLAPRAGELWRGRRVDPFVLLTCLGARRPGYQRPGGSLAAASERWSAHYTAAFDVDAKDVGSSQVATRD